MLVPVGKAVKGAGVLESFHVELSLQKGGKRVVFGLCYDNPVLFIRS